MVTIRVPGIPAPQGSKSFKGISKKGRAIFVESSKAVKPWRSAIVARVLGFRYGTLKAPYSVEIDFYFARPKSLPKKVSDHMKKPDLDKLVRATLDALVISRLIDDDSQVVAMRATKRYSAEFHGAIITVEEVVMKKRRHVRDIASMLANSNWVRWWCMLGHPTNHDECIQIRDENGTIVWLEGLGESQMLDEGFVFCVRYGIQGYHRKGEE